MNLKGSICLSLLHPSLDWGEAYEKINIGKFTIHLVCPPDSILSQSFPFVSLLFVPNISNLHASTLECMKPLKAGPQQNPSVKDEIKTGESLGLTGKTT